MTTIRSLEVATVLAAVLAMPLMAMTSGPALSEGAVARASDPHVTELQLPQNLPIGAEPQVAYLAFADFPHSTEKLIFRPGETPLDPESKHEDEHLTRVRHGFVLTSNHTRVRFVRDDGSQRQLVRAKSPDYVADAIASRDGRFVAVTLHSVLQAREKIVIRRISDDALVARRAFDSPMVVATFTRHVALLTTGRSAVDGPRPHRRMLTRRWDLDTGRLRTLDDAGRRTLGTDPMYQPGDLTAGQVAVNRGHHDRVIPIRASAHVRVWRTGAHERVQSWSPDDRFVLTAAHHGTSGGWDLLRVRRARDGALVTTYLGANNLFTDNSWEPAWETASTFVFTAGSDCGPDGSPEGGDCISQLTIRCTVRGACEQVALPVGADAQAQERQLPPS
ncbi:MAG TPA: hypothetical protein VHW64_01935 [Nocardioides sp.]|uniref:hypothetical protein n=1 Tax=Nocardioides sp. TaxID=35761 RepID=UPI002E2FD440|nr:hypothetical protein [Nocardioides sp.]HEX3929435.1 hypothetical protein [Nocardioides sp.]